MKLRELLNDHTVKAVRRKIWALPTDRLELPPVVKWQGEDSRGAWGVLIGHDGENPQSRTNICIPLLNDDNDDWEVWVDPDPFADRKIYP